MGMTPVKATGRVVMLTLKSSSVVEDVTVPGRAFLLDLGIKKEYLYRSFFVRWFLMRCPPRVLVSPGIFVIGWIDVNHTVLDLVGHV